jgi:hypothetical protein
MVAFDSLGDRQSARLKYPEQANWVLLRSDVRYWYLADITVGARN